MVTFHSFAQGLASFLYLHPIAKGQWPARSSSVQPQSCLNARALGDSASDPVHSLSFLLPSDVDQRFTELSGTLYAPTDSKARHVGFSTWSGVRPDGEGMLQNVLDGHDPNAWRMDSGWCCSSPDLPQGQSVWPQPGQGVRFVNRLQQEVWRTELQLVGGNQSRVADSFAVSMCIALNIMSYESADKDVSDAYTMIEAVFAIESHNASWDFGPVSFRNVTMMADSYDESWCSLPGLTTYDNNNNLTAYRVNGIRGTVDKSAASASCKIEELTLLGPRNENGTDPPHPDWSSSTALAPLTSGITDAASTSTVVPSPTSTSSASSSVAISAAARSTSNGGAESLMVSSSYGWLALVLGALSL